MNAAAPLNILSAAPVAPASLLSSRAMLAGLTIRQWSARKLDRKVTDETNRAHGASADAGRYNKALIAKDALAKIVSAANAARSVHYARTLPWLDDGARILPSMAYDRYAPTMRQLRADYEAAVAEFVANYPSFVADAQSRLGAMFDPNDYPSESEVKGRFTFAVRILPMPDANDFRAELSDNQAAMIRAEIAQASTEALNAAMADVWNRITDVVGRMVERLKAYKPAENGSKAEGIFRDSLIENARELLYMLPSFNLTNDPFLADIADRICADLVQHSADELRESATLREDTAKAAEQILADVSAYLM